MRRILMLLVLAGVAFLLLGCVEMFTANIFAAVDAPRVPSAEKIGELEEEELLDTVGDLIESPSFYEDLIAEAAASGGTSETKDAILEGLNGIIGESDGDTTPEEQEAALLVAEIELNTTAAGDVVDNFVTAATGLIDGDIDTSDTEALAEEIIGEVFVGVDSPEALHEAIDALLDAAVAFEFYGNSLDDNDTGEVVVPEGDNIGAVAQDAVVALLVAEVLDPSTGLTADDLVAYAFDDSVTTLPPFTLDGDPLTDNPALSNIIDASGLGALLEMEETV